MRRDGCRERHRIELRIVEQLLEAAGPRRGKAAQLASHELGRVVADPGELGFRQLVEVARQVGAPVAEPDDPDPQRIAHERTRPAQAATTASTCAGSSSVPIGRASSVAASSSVTGSAAPREALHRWLAVDRRAVVAASADAVLRERMHQPVGVIGEDHEEVVDVLGALGGRGQLEVLAEPGTLVALGDLPPGGVPAVELGQQHPQDPRLERIEARVVAHVRVVELVLRAVEAQHARPLGDLGVVGGDRTAVAEAGKVLGGEEAERGRVAERARHRPAERRSGRLGGVLEHGHAELAQLRDGCDVSEQIHRDDCGACARP